MVIYHMSIVFFEHTKYNVFLEAVQYGLYYSKRLIREESMVAIMSNSQYTILIGLWDGATVNRFIVALFLQLPNIFDV